MIKVMENIKGITESSLENCWVDVDPLFKDAYKRCGANYDSNEIKEGIKVGDYQLWEINKDNYALTSVVLYNNDSYKVLDVLCLVGTNMEEWLISLYYFLEFLAKYLKCQSIRAAGRPGWKKVLKSLGYLEECIVMIKKVNN